MRADVPLLPSSISSPRPSSSHRRWRAGAVCRFSPRAATPVPAWRTGNEVIDRTRDIALAILQPTAAQMQRAAELHASALVFDAYGFAPRAAIDGAAINAAVQAGASAERAE